MNTLCIVKSCNNTFSRDTNYLRSDNTALRALHGRLGLLRECGVAKSRMVYVLTNCGVTRCHYTGCLYLV